MGRIYIQVNGSFPEHVNSMFSAEEGGHAAALHRAIQALVCRLPKAIQRDHELHELGELPPNEKWGYGNPACTPAEEVDR